MRFDFMLFVLNKLRWRNTERSLRRKPKSNGPYLAPAPPHTVDDLEEYFKDERFPAYQDGPLQVGVDAAEHELAHDGGDGGKHQRSAQDPSG